MKNIFIGSALVVAASAGAFAQDSESAWSLDGYVALATDYRDRGLTLSDRDPSYYGSLSLSHEKGWFFGVDAARIDDQRGGDVRTEFFVGYQIDAGDFIYTLSAEVDAIHGNGSQYYPEFKASIARDFGLAYISSGFSVAPDGRWNTPDVDSYYSYVDLEVPVPTMPELTLITHVGYDIRDGRSDLWDWSAGLSIFVNDFELTLTFEDNSLDNRLSNGQFIVGTKFYF
ncbi:TorF family putative porin [Kordiimonas laminariae]|uniref:TorF family putative porin n=1 Tax=Kordiimonas laminariae TaxID=2917717 RepID=UPI001FF699F1|nr:TorF family putative porin [Kordiimonas laminariae]